MQIAVHAPCPILVVKEQPRTIKRIVFATDGSKNSKKALRFLVTELRSTNLTGRRNSSIEVAVVHALSLPVRSSLKWGGSHVREAAKKLREAGYTAVEIVDSEKPVDAILTTAAKRKTDLIVTGAQGLGAVAPSFWVVCPTR